MEDVASEMKRRATDVISLDEPVQDLRVLGEKLQQAICITRARLKDVARPRERLEMIRALDRAEYMFQTMSQTAQTVDRLGSVLKKNFGLDTDRLFSLIGSGETAARVTVRSAMVLVNAGISNSLRELSALNQHLDKDQKHGKKSDN